MKRKVAILFVAAILAPVILFAFVVRTRWAGEKLCGLAEARIAAAAGMEVHLGACRIRPFEGGFRFGSSRGETAALVASWVGS